MGNVMVVFRIMPDGTDTDLEKIKSSLVALGAKKTEEEPLAFGLTAIKAYFVVPDAEGGTEAVEKSVKAVSGVSEADIVEVNRMLF